MNISGIFWPSAALATLFLCADCAKNPAPAPAPPEVQVAQAILRDQPIVSEWIATTDGFVNAQIRAQVTGYLMTQNYREGFKVKKGDLLFEIDPRPFQAALDQAQAQMKKTELDVKRLTPLAKENAVSQEELDDAVQANLANKAAVEAAQLNLGFTKIASPIDGIAGIATAQIGDLVGPTTGNLTAVSQVDPIKVYFAISEQEYLSSPALFASEGETGKSEPALQLLLSNGELYGQQGKLYLADRQVDPRTGTLRIAAIFPNPGDVLRPGQFARVRAATHVHRGALLVPQRAVTELQGIHQLAVVGTDNKVDIRQVTVGDRADSLWIIEKGLNPGERVVVEGLQKVRQGQVVAPKPVPAQRAPAPPPGAAPARP